MAKKSKAAPKSGKIATVPYGAPGGKNPMSGAVAAAGKMPMTKPAMKKKMKGY